MSVCVYIHMYVCVCIYAYTHKHTHIYRLPIMRKGLDGSEKVAPLTVGCYKSRLGCLELAKGLTAVQEDGHSRA